MNFIWLSQCFFLIFIYLVIYIIYILAVLGLHYFSLVAASGGYPLVVVPRILTAVAFLYAERRL